MTRITQPGIYALSDAAYLADPVIEPSLNNSIVKLLVDLSPAHAYAAHPRLGGAAEPADADASEEMSIGSAAHAMFLRGGDVARLIPFATYQSNDAKAARDAALAQGLIPLKPKAYDAAHRVVEALDRLRQETGLFTAGRPEQTIVWREGEAWCRCKVDWLPDDPAAPLWDLKTTGGSATARSWGRACFDHGVDTQASWYTRGAESVRGEPPDGMCFVVVETAPPHGVRVFGLSPPAIDMADGRVRAGIDLWAECTRTGSWPSYERDVEWLDPPPWILREWETRQYMRSRRPGMRPIGEAVSDVVARMIERGNLAG